MFPKFFTNLVSARAAHIHATPLAPLDAEDRLTWLTVVKQGVIVAKERRMEEATDKGAMRKAKTLCRSCGKDCHSRIGLHSHSRKCNPTQL